MDDHPDLGQTNIVNHFRTLQEGALIFSQSALSRNIKRRQELEAWAGSTPTALSSKRVRVVTQPDVEKSLILWIRHLEEMGETVTGPMLLAKRQIFEALLNVPEMERLQGAGWVSKFCKV
jgi:Tc5 transposase DNA-binding domain